MKNLSKLFVFLLLTSVFFGCEEDLIIFDADNGQTALSFGETSYSVSVPLENLSLEIPVNSTTRAAADRNFSAVVNVDGTTPGTSAEYAIGSITIPAGEFVGVLTVDFTYANIGGMDGDVKNLVLDIDVPDGAASFNDQVNITYFREIVCNNVVVTIVPDAWPSETSWEITEQATGNVVASGGANSATVNLPDGCYTFTIFDAFSDGICCAYGNGSYSVDCSIINHASGAEFGASESTDFCVNP